MPLFTLSWCQLCFVNRSANVRVTSYGDTENSSNAVKSELISKGNVTDIKVQPPSPSWEGPFVVNVTSSQNITLVAMRNGTSSFGSYTVYPINNAGRFYDIVSFPSASETQQAEVIVIGIDDGPTGITFKSLRNFTLAGGSTDTFSMQINYDSLNRTLYSSDGQLRKRQFIIFRSIDDLTASTISSETDSRIIVICSSYCPNESCDVLLEQMPPIQTLGKSYFIVPAKDYAGESLFRVLSPWGNTTVITQSLQAMDDDTNFTPSVLSMGEYFDIGIQDGSIQNVVSIEGSKPLLLMHYLIKSNEPLVTAAMTLIPSVEQFTYGNTTLSTYNITSTPGSAIRNFVNIITKCDLKRYVLYNRRSIPNQNWTPCPMLNDPGPLYCATQQELTKNGKHTLESHSKYPLTEFSAVQYGIRTDKSAFASTVFMSFEELTCNVSKDGVTIPCKDTTPTIPPTIRPTLPTQGFINMTTVFSSNPPVTDEPTTGNKTDSKNSTSRREKAGTGKLTKLFYQIIHCIFLKHFLDFCCCLKDYFVSEFQSNFVSEFQSTYFCLTPVIFTGKIIHMKTSWNGFISVLNE